MNISVWNKLSRKYDNIWLQKYSLLPTRKKVIEIIRSRYGSDSDISLFDSGCGTGQFLKEIKDAYPKIILSGMDIAAEMINIAKEKKIQATFFNGNICDISLKNHIPENSIDIVSCCHSFPYYLDKKTALRNIHDILKPGGYAIFVQGSVNNFYDKMIMRIIAKTTSESEYLSKQDMCDLVKDYFYVEDVFTIRERFYMASICGFVVRK
ncbi:MAG: class I SAM-dependent DNA methyltransferase [Saccharofermentanales bacterium]